MSTTTQDQGWLKINHLIEQDFSSERPADTILYNELYQQAKAQQLLASPAIAPQSRAIECFHLILPIYNNERWLKDLVDSLEQQDYPGDINFIFIDDGSTDNSVAVVKELASRLIREKALLQGRWTCSLIEQVNSGASIARNQGIRAAIDHALLNYQLEREHGKPEVQLDRHWLLFIDTDDWVARDYLTGFAEMIRAESTLLMPMGVIQRYSQVTKKFGSLNLEIPLHTSEYSFDLVNNVSYSRVMARAGFRLDIIAEHQIGCPQQVNYGEDLVFNWIYSILASDSVKNAKAKINAELFYYYRREHQSSLSAEYEIANHNNLVIDPSHEIFLAKYFRQFALYVKKVTKLAIIPVQLIFQLGSFFSYTIGRLFHLYQVGDTVEFKHENGDYLIRATQHQDTWAQAIALSFFYTQINEGDKFTLEINSRFHNKLIQRIFSNMNYIAYRNANRYRYRRLSTKNQHAPSYFELEGNQVFNDYYIKVELKAFDYLGNEIVEFSFRSPDLIMVRDMLRSVAFSRTHVPLDTHVDKITAKHDLTTQKTIYSGSIRARTIDCGATMTPIVELDNHPQTMRVSLESIAKCFPTINLIHYVDFLEEECVEILQQFLATDLGKKCRVFKISASSLGNYQPTFTPQVTLEVTGLRAKALNWLTDFLLEEQEKDPATNTAANLLLTTDRVIIPGNFKQIEERLSYYVANYDRAYLADFKVYFEETTQKIFVNDLINEGKCFTYRPGRTCLVDLPLAVSDQGLLDPETMTVIPGKQDLLTPKRHLTLEDFPIQVVRRTTGLIAGLHGNNEACLPMTFHFSLQNSTRRHLVLKANHYELGVFSDYFNEHALQDNFLCHDEASFLNEELLKSIGRQFVPIDWHNMPALEQPE